MTWYQLIKYVIRHLMLFSCFFAQTQSKTIKKKKKNLFGCLAPELNSEIPAKPEVNIMLWHSQRLGDPK